MKKQNVPRTLSGIVLCPFWYVQQSENSEYAQVVLWLQRLMSSKNIQDVQARASNSLHSMEAIKKAAQAYKRKLETQDEDSESKKKHASGTIFYCLKQVLAFC